MSSETKAGTDSNWERKTLEKLANASLVEQRRARRWNLLFKFFMLTYLCLLLVIYLPDDWSEKAITSGSHTALIDISGVIADDAEASGVISRNHAV